jgi:predicted secreted protein
MTGTLLRFASAGVLAVSLFALAACGDDDDANSDGNGGNGNGGDTTPAPAEVQLTQDDDGSTVTLAADGTLIVALPANPDEGMSWAIVSPEPEFLSLDGAPRFVPAGSTSPVGGAAGTEVFTLQATGAGTSSLTMEYHDTNAPEGEPDDTFSVTVETR